jgi:hypothetical protein
MRRPNPDTLSVPIEAISVHSHCSILLKEDGLRQSLCEAVGENLGIQYIAQVDLSVTSHVSSKTVLGRNMCNCSATVGAILDARDE